MTLRKDIPDSVEFHFCVAQDGKPYVLAINRVSGKIRLLYQSSNDTFDLGLKDFLEED